MGDSERLATWLEVDSTVPNGGRIYDYLLGGNAHFAVDREAAKQSAAMTSAGLEGARATVRANRNFLVRAMRYLVQEAGVRQFLDIGSGIPNDDNVHALAQQLAPESRVVYVDNDPVVLAHAHQLLRSTPEGAISYLSAKLQNPQAILTEATNTLDFSKPIAVMLISILHFVSDEEDPYGIVSTLLDAVPSGSYLALSHLGDGISPVMNQAVIPLREATGEPWALRSQEQTHRFFDGLEVVHPGVVQVDRWPSEGDVPLLPDGHMAPFYAGVGHKR